VERPRSRLFLCWQSIINGLRRLIFLATPRFCLHILRMIEVSVEYLRRVLSYDLETGELRWRIRPPAHFSSAAQWHLWNARFAGRTAGSCCDGYLRLTLTIEGKLVSLYVHRVAWALKTGAWPLEEVDHRNGDGYDNRFSNLRLGTHAENQQNRIARYDNASGLVGATWNKGDEKWQAQIFVGGRSHYLGQFNTPEAAHAAYLEAKQRLHPYQPVPRDLMVESA
jgi:hypothetical protein